MPRSVVHDVVEVLLVSLRTTHEHPTGRQQQGIHGAAHHEPSNRMPRTATSDSVGKRCVSSGTAHRSRPRRRQGELPVPTARERDRGSWRHRLRSVPAPPPVFARSVRHYVAPTQRAHAAEDRTATSPRQPTLLGRTNQSILEFTGVSATDRKLDGRLVTVRAQTDHQSTAYCSDAGDQRQRYQVGAVHTQEARVGPA